MEGRGFVEFSELCEGLACLEEVVTGRRLLNLDCGVKRQCAALHGVLNRVGDDVGMLRRDMVIKHAQLMARIHAVLGSKVEGFCSQDSQWGRSPSDIFQGLTQLGRSRSSLLPSMSSHSIENGAGRASPSASGQSSPPRNSNSTRVSDAREQYGQQEECLAVLVSQGSCHMLSSQGSEGAGTRNRLKS